MKKILLFKLPSKVLRISTKNTLAPMWFRALFILGFQMVFAQETPAISVLGGAQIFGESQMRYAQPTRKIVYKKNIKKTCVETSARKRTKKLIETVKKIYTYRAVKFDLAKQNNAGDSQISNGKYASNCATPGFSYHYHGINDSVYHLYASIKFFNNNPVDLEQQFIYFEYRGKKRNKSPPAIRVI